MKKFITVIAIVFAVSACSSKYQSSGQKMDSQVKSEQSYNDMQNMKHKKWKKWKHSPEKKFSKIDKDNSDTISYEEFKAYHNKKKADKNCPMASKSPEEMFESIDSNNNNELSLEEFRSWKSDRMQQHKRMKKRMHKNNKGMNY